jgi:hypothetical protein
VKASVGLAAGVSQLLSRKRIHFNWLFGLLIGSLALRIELVSRGGAGFWPDEGRYGVAVSALQFLRTDQIPTAITVLLREIDHLGFKLVMMLPAWGQLTWGWSNSTIALLGSGLFSVANIAWVYALARRLGASRVEAYWSAFFMAASVTMFYYSRHLLPYDMSLFWGLACMYVGLKQEPHRWHSVTAGVLGFLSFVTYNGNWYFVAFALAVHVFRGWGSYMEMAKRGLLALIGLAGSVALLDVAMHRVGFSLIAEYAGFAGTVTQGISQKVIRYSLAISGRRNMGWWRSGQPRSHSSSAWYCEDARET